MIFPVAGHSMTQAQMDASWNAHLRRNSAGARDPGVDIMAPKGTAVVAVDDGIIMPAPYGVSSLGGNRVWLKTRDGYYYYAHLANITVPAGTHVQAGDIIGTVGNTGNAAGGPPHLHFSAKTDMQGFWEQTLATGSKTQFLNSDGIKAMLKSGKPADDDIATGGGSTGGGLKFPDLSGLNPITYFDREIVQPFKLHFQFYMLGLIGMILIGVAFAKSDAGKAVIATAKDAAETAAKVAVVA